MTKKRLKSPSSIYHVYSRGIKKEKFFFDKEDRLSLHYKLEDAKNKYDLNFTTHAYAYLDNHFHLLLETFDEDLSKIMQNVLSRFASDLNEKYNRSGYVFEGRFGSRMIFSIEHFLTVQAYIHNNWIEAGIEENTYNKLFCSYSSFIDGKSLFAHFQPDKSLKLYTNLDSSKTTQENFISYTQSKQKNQTINFNYDFSNHLAVIDKYIQSYDEKERWFIASFLLRKYTNANYNEICSYLNFENPEKLKVYFHRKQKTYEQKYLKEICKSYQNELKNVTDLLRAEM